MAADFHDCEVCPCPTPDHTHCPCLHNAAQREPQVVSHLAGPVVEFNTEDGTLLRQRCQWCGSTLVDENLSRISVPVGQEGPYPTWEVGRFIDSASPDQQGGVHWLNDWTDGPVPETACLRMPPEVTR